MRNIFIIPILLLFACDALEEQTEPLSGMYYVSEGWDAFVEQDYDRAQELFSAALLGDEGGKPVYYDHAYAGLGWTAIYKANVNPGDDKRTLRDDLRLQAIEHFESAHDLMDLKIDLEQLESSLNQLNEIDLFLYQNILVGEIYGLRYQAHLKEDKFYTQGRNPEDWDDVIYFSEQVIIESTDFISQFENYNFQYDEKINIGQIRKLKVESYLLLGNIESAMEEAVLITNSDCGTSILSIEICLNTFFNLP